MTPAAVVRPSAFHSPVRKTRLLLASLPIFAGLLSEDGRVLECNFAPLGGPLQGRTDWIGRPFETGPWWNYSEGSRAEILILLGRAQRGEAVSKERLYRKPDNTMGVMMLSLTPLFAPYGQPDAILVTAVDVTERRRETDTAAQIAHDMSHRLRNSFTIMRALATRASDEDDTPRQTLSRRLSRIRDSHALSYRYLFFDVPIQDIVVAAIDNQDQLSRYEYDPVSVSADHVETLILAFGELSRPGHKAELLAQRCGADHLRLIWKEASPRSDEDMPEGLADVLIRANPEQAMQGTVKVENAETGFVWTLDFPIMAREPFTDDPEISEKGPEEAQTSNDQG